MLYGTIVYVLACMAACQGLAQRRFLAKQAPQSHFAVGAALEFLPNNRLKHKCRPVAGHVSCMTPFGLQIVRDLCWWQAAMQFAHHFWNASNSPSPALNATSTYMPQRPAIKHFSAAICSLTCRKQGTAKMSACSKCNRK